MSEKLIKGRVNATKGISKTNAIPASITRRAEILNVLKSASIFDYFFYPAVILFGLVCVALFYSNWMTYITVIQMYCALIAANLIAHGKIIGIWINIIDCLLYGVIAYFNQAYGELIKGVLIHNAFNVYGLVCWSSSAKQTSDNNFSVRKFSLKRSLIIYPAFVAVTVGLYFILKAVGTNKAFLAALVFSTSIMIKYLQMTKFRESWYFALACYCLNIVMWSAILVDGISKNNDWSVLPTVGGSIGNFINSINGLIVWNKLSKQSKQSGSVYLALRPIPKINEFVRLKHNYAHLTWSEKTDHIPTQEEIEIYRKMNISFRRGMFSGN